MPVKVSNFVLSVKVNVCIFISTKGFSKDQLQYVEDNTAAIAEREREIIAIVQSISELNEIFKDLANLIVDQVSL